PAISGAVRADTVGFLVTVSTVDTEETRDVCRVHDVREAQAHELVPGPAVVPRCGSVDGEDLERLGVEDPHWLRVVFEQRAKGLLAPADLGGHATMVLLTRKPPVGVGRSRCE